MGGGERGREGGKGGAKKEGGGEVGRETGERERKGVGKEAESARERERVEASLDDLRILLHKLGDFIAPKRKVHPDRGEEGGREQEARRYPADLGDGANQHRPDHQPEVTCRPQEGQGLPSGFVRVDVCYVRRGCASQHRRPHPPQPPQCHHVSLRRGEGHEPHSSGQHGTGWNDGSLATILVREPRGGLEPQDVDACQGGEALPDLVGGHPEVVDGEEGEQGEHSPRGHGPVRGVEGHDTPHAAATHYGLPGLQGGCDFGGQRAVGRLLLQGLRHEGVVDPGHSHRGPHVEEGGMEPEVVGQHPPNGRAEGHPHRKGSR
eukprot:Sspe_Gene.26684::Locus_11217_Transcript_1_1_Confidence_1.000_Length_1748::g.26684::m.26684